MVVGDQICESIWNKPCAEVVSDYLKREIPSIIIALGWTILALIVAIVIVYLIDKFMNQSPKGL